MANGIRTGDPSGFNKGCSSKFCIGSWVRQTPEESQRTYQPKCCGNTTKAEDNSLKTLNDRNHQASSQKFRQLKYLFSDNKKSQVRTLSSYLTRITTITYDFLPVLIFRFFFFFQS